MVTLVFTVANRARQNLHFNAVKEKKIVQYIIINNNFILLSSSARLYEIPRILLPESSGTNQKLFVFLCVVQFQGYTSIISKRIFLFFGSNCSSCIVLDVSDGHNPWPFFSTMSLFLGPVDHYDEKRIKIQLVRAYFYFIYFPESTNRMHK